MAFVHGTKARFYYNAVHVTPYLREGSLTATTEVAESTVLTDTDHTYGIGQRTRPSSFAGLYDNDLAVIKDNLGSSGGVLTSCFGGASAIGDLAWLSPVISSDYEESATVGDMVAFAWASTSSGPVAFGYVLHPLAEDTNTTTGATRDDAAATTTGWVGHLHVTAVDAGSWVIKLEDSANGSAWSDVTGGAFTAATGATSQRLVSAAGATLRRYVRYSATRTGGTSGDGITFLLAISRAYAP